MSEIRDGRQRGELRVDLKPGRLERLREAAAQLEMTDAEILRACVDLALPQLLAQLRAAESVSCRQNAAIYGPLAANPDREVRALDAEPSFRVAVPEPAAKTPQSTEDWRQISLPSPVPPSHPHTHEGPSLGAGKEDNPTAKGVCEGEGSGEGASRRQNAANGSCGAEGERAAFRAWYAAYPVQVGEGAAWRAWRDTRRGRPPVAELLAALDAQRRSPRWREGVIPNPATYLRDRRWTDRPESLTPILRSARSDSEARALRAGGERAAAVPFDLGDRLAELCAGLPPALPQRDRRAQEIRALAQLPLDRVELELGRIDGEVLADLAAAADPAVLEALAARTAADLAALRGRLPPEECDRQGARMRAAGLRQLVGHHPLSLY